RIPRVTRDEEFLRSAPNDAWEVLRFAQDDTRAVGWQPTRLPLRFLDRASNPGFSALRKTNALKFSRAGCARNRAACAGRVRDGFLLCRAGFVWRWRFRAGSCL